MLPTRRHAPKMPATSTRSTWWTDERIDATINREYVLAQLELEERDQLDRPLGFGNDLTDETYLDWILTRARRFFLILVEIGVPDQIFGVVDESYDDADLPIPADAVADLRLSYARDSVLDRKFFKTQYHYIAKDIREGEHVRYGQDEAIPVELVGNRASITSKNKDGTDKVYLPGIVSKLYARKHISLNEAPDYLVEGDVLAEVASMKRFVHEHVVTIYGSYTSGKSIYILLTPAAEYSLKSFINDPQQFKGLLKSQRREILINWPHCLADGLAWLHSKDQHHGAIRPSNVMIDTTNRIFLGQFDTYKIIRSEKKINGLEAYNYAAPERWVRAPIAQGTAPTRTTLHSGGRTTAYHGAPQTAPKQSVSSNSSPNSAASEPHRSSWTSDISFSPPSLPDTTQPSNTASPLLFNVESFRPSSSKKSYAPSLNSSHSSTTNRIHRSSSAKKLHGYTSSLATSTSSHSSGATQRPPTALPNPIAVPAPTLQTAVVQTWQSQQLDPLPSDIFALAAITLDILTYLCKRSARTFSNHRSAKNRTAGRGSGLADASFHANLGQLASWIDMLDNDAFKKDDEIFRALPPMLALVTEMLSKDPEKRPKCDQVERRFEDAIWRFAKLSELHCQSGSEKYFHHAPAPVLPKVGGIPMPALGHEEDDRDTLDDSFTTGVGLATDAMGLPNFSHGQTVAKPTGMTMAAESTSSSESTFNVDYGFQWEDFDEGDEDDDTLDKDHLEPLSLRNVNPSASQDSFLLGSEASTEFPPRRVSSMSNADSVSTEETSSTVRALAASPTPNDSHERRPSRNENQKQGHGHKYSWSRSWPLPGANEVDEALGVEEFLDV